MSEVFMDCGHSNCFLSFIDKFKQVSIFTFKLYALTHFGPTLVFHFKDLERKPKELIIKTVIKIARSMAFLGGWMLSNRLLFCLSSYFKKKIDLTYIIASTASSYLETTQRLNDYIVFCSPRALEGIWDLLESLKIVSTIPHSDKLIFILSMTIALYIRKYYPSSVPKNYEKIFSFVFGKNI